LRQQRGSRPHGKTNGKKGNNTRSKKQLSRDKNSRNGAKGKLANTDWFADIDPMARVHISDEVKIAMLTFHLIR
jgi:hypothetical protein